MVEYIRLFKEVASWFKKNWTWVLFTSVVQFVGYHYAMVNLPLIGQCAIAIMTGPLTVALYRAREDFHGALWDELWPADKKREG